MKRVSTLVVGCVFAVAGLCLDGFWWFAPDGNRSPYLLAANALPGALILAMAFRPAGGVGGSIKAICSSLLVLAILFAGVMNAGGKVMRDNMFRDARRYSEFRDSMERRWRGSIFPRTVPPGAADVKLNASILLDPAVVLDFHAPSAYLRSVTETYLPRAKYTQDGSKGLPLGWWTCAGSPNQDLPNDFKVIVLKTAGPDYYWPVQGVAVSAKRREIIYFFVGG